MCVWYGVCDLTHVFGFVFGCEFALGYECVFVCLSLERVGCDCLLRCFGEFGCACDFVCLVMIADVRELGY